jgi:hypothetical protein
MSNDLNRRHFLKRSVAGAAGAGFSFEERLLLAKKMDKNGQQKADSPEVPADSSDIFPMGQLGNLKVSRLICGGNLISGYAHSRDLIYVSELLRQYNSEEKVMDTWELCEERGINAVLADPREKPMRILNRYWNERGGKIKWIAEGHPKVEDIETNLKISIDNGASAIYIQGGVSDKWVEGSRVDLIGKAVDFIRKNGVVAGVGAHKLEVVKAVEEAGIEVDFYMKTLNTVGYLSDSPAETIEYMKGVTKPWIAFKVLGAGAVHPNAAEGFYYAFKKGADFICVGMFDFQVNEDVIIARKHLELVSKEGRERPWRA